MLRIVVSGENIDIFSNTSIALKLKNPAFDDNSILGSYSFPFKIPASNKNRRIFDFPERIEKIGVVSKEFAAQVFFDGLLMLDCGIVIKKIESNNYYDSYIKAGVGYYNSQIQEKTLKDLDLGGQYVFEGLQAHTDKMNYISACIFNEYPEYKFASFPVLNNIFYKDTNVNDTWLEYPVINDAVYDNSLYVYLGYILRQIFESFGYECIENPFENDLELKKLVNFYPQQDFDFETYESFNLKDHVPAYLISKFLINIKKVFGCGYFINHITKKVRIKLFKNIIKNAEIIEFSKNVNPNYRINPIDYEDGYECKFTFDDVDISANDGNIDPILKNQHTIADDVLTFFDLPDYGWANYLHQGEARLVKNENAYYFLKQGEDLGGGNFEYTWTFLTWNFYPLISGKGELQINPEISPLMMTRYNWGETSFILLPQCDENLFKNPNFYIGENCKENKNEFLPRLMFYRGMHLDSDEDNYPLGTNDIYDYFGSIIGSLSLLWEGDYGLLENFWKEYIYWYFNIKKEVEFTKILTAKDISILDFSAKHRINRINYFINEINVTLTNNEIKPAELIMYKC